MKIIITYASAGAGHFKAAQAIYNEFRATDSTSEVTLIDALDYTNDFFKQSYIRGYGFMINYASWLWALSFYLTAFKPMRMLINSLHFMINRINAKRLIDFLVKESPDFIISTHFLPSQVTAYLKRKKRINSKLLTIITDFGVHPFWLDEGVDIYVVASDFTRQILLQEGIAESKIKVLGIPIDRKFLAIFDREMLERKLKLSKEKFTVLVITGSFGIGPIEQIVDSLYKEVQIIAVCAKNKKLLQRLKDKNYPYLKALGFVDNVEELMAVSDMIITKPGGLTISEVLAMELPPLFISAIPGQENINANFLVKQGIAKNIRNFKKIKDIVMDYKNNPQKLLTIKEKIRQIKKPDAAGEIYHAVCSGSIGPSC